MKTLFYWAILATGACGGASSPTTETQLVWVGHLEGTDAVVAVVSRGTAVKFYLCGGPSTFGTLTHWFSGALSGASLHATAVDSADVLLDGTLTGGQAWGTVTLKTGEAVAWTAHPATPDTLEGLYATVDEGCRTGVVVTQPSADQPPAVQGTWCNAAKQHLQVTPMHPIQLVSGSLAVEVEGLANRRILEVTPLELSTP
jgi:hypothetical protein